MDYVYTKILLLKRKKVQLMSAFFLLKVENL